MTSIRLRLTVWNAGVISAILLAFSGATYVLVRHGTMEQVEQAGWQQLRNIELTASAHHFGSPDSAPDASGIVADLTGHGYYASLSNDGAILVATAHRLRGDEHINGAPENTVEFVEALKREAQRTLKDGASDKSAAPKRTAFNYAGANGGVRVFLSSASSGRGDLIVATIEPLEEVAEFLAQARTIILIAIPLLVLLSAAVGYAQARNALAPVAEMTRQARRIGAKNLHERLIVANPEDELGQLAGTFNAVLDRVDSALEQQRRFTADASHELRTPIAIVRSEADVSLDSVQASPEELRASMSVIQAGSEQLSRIVNDMFLLARADAGQVLRIPSLLYLDEIAQETARSMARLAARRNIRIDVRSTQDMPLEGDEELLRRALANLLDNAIKYARPGTVIELVPSVFMSTYVVLVTNEGPGIPESSRPLIFDRFYRVDRSRSANSSAHGSGAGLGLAIAREIVELHGGLLELRQSAAHRTTFAMSFPAGIVSTSARDADMSAINAATAGVVR